MDRILRYTDLLTPRKPPSRSRATSRHTHKLRTVRKFSWGSSLSLTTKGSWLCHGEPVAKFIISAVTPVPLAKISQVCGIKVNVKSFMLHKRVQGVIISLF